MKTAMINNVPSTITSQEISDEIAARAPWPEEITTAIRAVRDHNYVVINDHNSNPEPMRVGIWLHRPNLDPYWGDRKPYEEYYLVGLPKDGSMCCLNPIKLDNGIPHLSRWSVGDNIWAGLPSPYHPERDLAEGISAYNWFYLGSEVEHGHPCNSIPGVPPFDNNRLVYAEGRHEKFIWSEKDEEVRVIRF